MPARLKDVEIALERVKALYKESCETARKEHSKKPEFNLLIREVVRGMFLSEDERTDLIHELAKFFGRRGGKAPRKLKPNVPKPPKRPRLKKSLKKLVTCEPINLSKQLQLDMLNMSKEAHEDICPLA